MSAPRLLFVCLGNICRSPAAEAVVRARATADGVEVATDSAGTGGWHVGNPPHPPMQGAARRRGIDMSDLRARQFGTEDFDRFDQIFVMDRANKRNVEAMRPRGATTPVTLFLDETGTDGAEVPDPYYDDSYDRSLDLIEEAAEALLARLAR